MSGYDTNLASEFYVLSCLHRIGLTANLTLGNKKGVDIIVARKAGDAVTVEVKGTAKKYDWLVNNLSSANPDRHFVALVSLEGRIEDPSMPAPPPRVDDPLPGDRALHEETRGGTDEYGVTGDHSQNGQQVRERLGADRPVAPPCARLAPLTGSGARGGIDRP